MLQGACGNTLKQIQDVLHIIGDKESIANQFQEYFAQTAIGSSTSPLSVANRLYVNNDYTIKYDFKATIKQKFGFDIQSLNFANPVGSASIINAFVEENTKNKITNLIQPNSLKSNTGIVAVNAIYFKSEWATKFDKKLSYKGDFFIDETQSVPANYMRKKSRFGLTILRDLNATALELKYKMLHPGTAFSFVAILPDSRTGLSALESNLKNYDFNEIIGRFFDCNVDATIPKFKTTFEIKLNDVLKEVKSHKKLFLHCF